MKQQIVPFVDHEIGYRLLQKIIVCSTANNFEIPAVVTTHANGNAWWPSVGEICLKENIPLYIYEKSFTTEFLTLQPDWFLLLSWKHVIPIDLIKVPKKGVLNLHYSLLPAFRGVYPVNWSIINGENVTGFTYHFVNERIDDGEIFMQVEVPVRLSDTSRTLQLRLDNAVYDQFDKFIEYLLKFSKQSLAESKLMSSKTTKEYYSMQKFKKICALDLDASYRGIDFFNLLRGLTFFPDSKNAYILDKTSGKKIYVSIKIVEE